MKIFIAGGSGTIGVPLVRALFAAAHEVTAPTFAGQAGGSAGDWCDF